MVPHDHPNDVVGGFGGIVMTNHSRAAIEGRLEKAVKDFALASSTDVERDLTPRIGNENDILRCRFAAKLVERLEIPSTDSDKLIVGDALDIDDPGKFRPFLTPVEKSSPEDREMMNADVHLRSQESSNHPQNLRIALWGATQSRSIDKNDPSPIESELVCELNLDRTRLQARPNTWIRTTCEIDI